MVELQVALVVGLVVLIQPLEHRHDLSVAKPVGSCCKHIGYCRVHGSVVTLVTPYAAHARRTENFREVSIEDNILPLCNHHSVETQYSLETPDKQWTYSLASLLEQCLLIPVRVEVIEERGHTIVLTEKQCVHRCQANLREQRYTYVCVRSPTLGHAATMALTCSLALTSPARKQALRLA